MSRDLSAALETAIAAQVVRPFLAVRIELPDPVYAFTGRGLLTFDDADGNSREWIGAGDVAAIDTIGESTDGSATGIKCVLNAIPSEFRDDIAQQAVRGVVFEVYVGALNETWQQVEATHLIWKGRLDTYTITDGGETLSVEVTGESRGIDQRRPAIKRFTDEWQQRKYPGDKFFEYVPQMTEISVLWAQAELTTGGIRNVPVSGTTCPTVDALILMAGGLWKPAGLLEVGDKVRTRHEHTMEWGEYPVEAVEIAPSQPVFEVMAGKMPLRATAEHRLFVDGRWQTIRELGQPSGVADVVKITVTDAHTYVSNGLLSHNVKNYSL